MDVPAWREHRWLQLALVVLTVLATVCLAAHPELRLLVPILDALGLDLMVLLVGGQLLEFARPYARMAWDGVLALPAKMLYLGGIFFLGSMGPYFDGALRSRGLSLW